MKSNFWHLPKWISKLPWISDPRALFFPSFFWRIFWQLFYACPITGYWECRWQTTCLFSSEASRLRATVFKVLSHTQTWLRWWDSGLEAVMGRYFGGPWEGECTLFEGQTWITGGPKDHCFLAFPLVCACLPHCRSWSVWPIQYSRSGGMSLLRLGYRWPHLLSWVLSLSLSLSDYLPWGKPAAMLWGCLGSLCTGPRGEELRPPTKAMMDCSLPATMCMNLEVDPLAPGDCGPDWELDFNLKKDSDETIWLSCFQISNSQKLWEVINVCFKVLSFGVICYTVIDSWYIRPLSLISPDHQSSKHFPSISHQSYLSNDPSIHPSIWIPKHYPSISLLSPT